MLNRYHQKRIHTTIDLDDYDYMKKHNLKAAHLIRGSIRDHRVHTNDPLANPTAREMLERNKKITARLNQLLGVMRKILSEKEFDKLMQKL